VRGALWAAAVAFLLTFALFLAQRRIDWSYDEEGFQWYGAVAVAHGQIPLRDFYSYDPGRYYWNGIWAKILGEGVLALRLSTALFGALGLWLGLLAARRAVPHPLLLLPVGVVLLLFMLPRNKLFESALAMAAVWAAVLLLENPSRGRHLLAGAVVGLAGFFGKNLGGYLVLAFLLLLLWQRFRLAAPGEPGLRERLLAWAAGVALGASPLLLLACAPGFFRAYVDSILFFVQQGKTNFPLPIPWPWRARPGASLQEIFLGISFLLVPLALGLAALVALRTRRESLPARVLVVAALPMGFFYAHHMFSRADMAHLGSSIHPALLALLALPAALSRKPWRLAAGCAVALLLGSVTLFSALPAQPFYEQWTTGHFIPYTVAGDPLLIRAGIADFVGWAEGAVAKNVPPGEPILLAPNMPGLYPFFGRLSPVWNIFPIWPAEGRLDERMLRELQEKNVKWALLQNASVDGHRDLRFPNTHPEVWDYLMTEFEPVDLWKPEHPRRGMLLRRKGAGP
jgi:hypothetical protein